MSNDTQSNDSTDNPHADYETRCTTVVGTQMQEQQTAPDGEVREVETNEHCGTTLTYADHYVGMAGTTTARQEGYEQDALKFRCPDCGELEYRCPICSDSGQPGWFRGESTGDMLACHNCNAAEAQRQQRGRF